MEYKWKSKELYEHPAEHQKGVFGYIVMSKKDIYVLKVGGAYMSCPQNWASKKHFQESSKAKQGG